MPANVLDWALHEYQVKNLAAAGCKNQIFVERTFN